ncbi:MAG TPA: dihydrolipoamide acetyltransferase family protein [Solirubrobacterales bacterium]|nr:dihydrolipoamide acetyltransferase family protein [Solirubrobacterales bacterium]
MAQTATLQIEMPEMGESVTEGIVLEWHVAEGDLVKEGDTVVEISTDKVDAEVPAPADGVITKLIAQVDEEVPVGAPLAEMEPGEGGGTAEGSDRSAAGPVTGEGPAGGAAAPFSAPPPRHPQKGPVAPPGSSDGGGRPKASPLARRVAREKGLDLSQVQGSGPGGRIVKADVERAEPGAPAAAPTSLPAAVSEAPETAKGQTTYQDLSKLQSTIARRMAESKATAPHFYLEAEVDMSRAVEARERIKGAAAEGEVVPSFNDMIVKACALALREHPRANGAYRDGRFELYSRVNVGVAVAGQDGLVVPTVFDADRKGLRQIASESRGLAQRVRDGQITPPELSGATFTVSNLGMYGIDSFSAVINPPQAAILAVGAIKERPAVRGGQLVAAHLMTVTLACDHRILYGADGAEFLARIRSLLEEPLSLAL